MLFILLLFTFTLGLCVRAIGTEAVGQVQNATNEMNIRKATDANTLGLVNLASCNSSFLFVSSICDRRPTNTKR